ncbi:MAG: hypothetical protein BHW12_06515 [Coprobacillus sp. 28_7]|nr:MAG: hypothetical protein BHW12_06515 [Coprobacillus sp. 28_7]
MENTTFTQSNYSNHYNAFQLSLPLDLGIKINSDDEVVSFLKALEGVNLNKYLKRSECRGRKGYDNVMLLKVVLFARMIGFGDVRSMESLCKHDIRFMYIMKEETPSFMAFERLLKDYLIDDMIAVAVETFEDIREQLEQCGFYQGDVFALTGLMNKKFRQEYEKQIKNR